MKVIAFLVCIGLAVLLVIATADLPAWGSPSSPASSYLSPYYLTNALKDTATPNVVTAILADYRGFDTMLELTVILIAGFSVLLIMTTGRSVSERRDVRAIELSLTGSHHSGLTVKVTSQLLIPFAVIFALYVLAHGHYSPGGGFQAGVILGAIFILASFSHGINVALRFFPERLQILCALMGVTIYFGTGLICLIHGGSFLDYGSLAGIIGMQTAAMRSLAILIVETGVTMTVMSVMSLIFSRLAVSPVEQN